MTGGKITPLIAEAVKNIRLELERVQATIRELEDAVDKIKNKEAGAPSQVIDGK